MLTDRMSRDNNFKNFRESLRTVSPPSIPFLGLYLQDLTFIEDGNPNYLDEANGVINIAKRAQYSQIIKDIQLYQQTPYLLQPVPMVMDFLKVSKETILLLGSCFECCCNKCILKAMHQHTAEAVYDQSLLIKSRDKEAKELDEDISTTTSSEASKSKVRVADGNESTDWGPMAYPPNYAFAEVDSDDNIVVSEENHKMVLYGSIPKLVERLTFEKYSDQTFVSSFLLTHRMMMTSLELLELLIQRYNVPFPLKDDVDTRNKFEAKVVRPIRLRVFNGKCVCGVSII
jgi:hypothetical protein